jgi:hypothetical protein
MRTTILDVLDLAATARDFWTRFADDPLGAARAIGLELRARDAAYVQARLRALAQPLPREPGKVQLEEAAADMRTSLGFDPELAATEAARAVFFVRDYRFHQRFLNNGSAEDLVAVIGDLRARGSEPPPGCGTLLLTLHYGPFPLLWLWLKHGRHMPRCSLLYDSRSYAPDISAAQYARLSGAGIVPPSRGDLDLAVLGLRSALRHAVERLRRAETVLMFPDAYPVEPGGRTLVCRLGRLRVAYPRGAAWLAEAAEATVPSVVISPDRDGHVVFRGRPRAGAEHHDDVAQALQELVDASVVRDPAPWLGWFTLPDDGGEPAATRQADVRPCRGRGAPVRRRPSRRGA